MSAPPPDILTFVALEPPQNHSEKNGRWLWSAFRVPLEQLQTQTPLIYERLKAAGQDAAQVVVCHADAYGNLEKASLEAIDRFRPDVIFCCHPGDARRQYPALPIQGWSYKRVLFAGREGSRICQLVFEV